MANVLIIGPGALGAAIGAALQLKGYCVAYHGRNGPQAIGFDLDHGQQLGLMERGVQSYQFPAPDAEFYADVQLLLVAVKAYDLEQALVTCRGLSPSAPLVALGNGAVEDIILSEAAQQPERIWRLGVTTIGISQLQAQSNRRTYAMRSTAGVIGFGPFLGRSLQPTLIEASLTQEQVLWHWLPAAVAAHRRKWLFNTVINSLCAVHRLPRNGDLFMHLEELTAVFNDAVKLGEERWGNWLESPDSMHEALLNLIRSTSENENSMARDLRLGLRTETDFLAGLARSARSSFPRLLALHEAITKR